MTRFPYDQFAKDYLKELLQPFGDVTTSRTVSSEIREIDVFFLPSPQLASNITSLGLLGRLILEGAVIEPFRNAATPIEIRGCMNKLFDTFNEQIRQSKGDNSRIKESDFPRLWILSPTLSACKLKGFKADLDEENWGSGIYFMGDYIRTAIVVIHKLPQTQETLWLRILGRGRVQQQAIKELEALPQNNRFRSQAIDLLLGLKATIEVNKEINKDDRRLIMQLSTIYQQELADAREKARQQGFQEGLQEGLQEGRQEGRQEAILTERRATIENLLQIRFGSLDEDLSAIVDTLSALSPGEFTPLLLRLSREELLAQFRD